MDATDRCDTCGAQAYVRAVVKGTVLLYCGHHGTKYMERLTAQADEPVYDETWRLFVEEAARD